MDEIKIREMGYGRAMIIAEQGLTVWREKPHNAKWWKRIDGTPIPNDLLSCIAEMFAVVKVDDEYLRYGLGVDNQQFAKEV